MKAFPWLSGIRIVEDPRLVKSVQFRFPRSKKRRIRRKWSKVKSNFKDVGTSIMFGSNVIACHPSIVSALRRQLHSKP